MAAVGWIGLGKLGGPCSAALAHYGGYDVYGYDPYVKTVDTDGLDAIERCVSVNEVVKHTDDIVFVAVQTPHVQRFDGARLLPTDVIPEDFEYGYLVEAVASVAQAATRQAKRVTIVVISTVLPGTTSRELRPLLNSYTDLVYHPFFIAMGTVVADFTHPEFVLLGCDDVNAATRVAALYEGIHEAPLGVMSIASAELTKVAYNTFISTKIVFANTIAQVADVTGADVDEVTSTLTKATDRLISSKYLTAGMGDGGGCHPRDNIALSAIAQRHGIADFMGGLNVAREEHTRWLADIAQHWVEMSGFNLVVLGKSFKPNIGMTDGSPALLLADILRENNVSFTQLDSNVDKTVELDWLNDYYPNGEPCVFFIATAHSRYATFPYSAGSVVIDPFGIVIPRDFFTLVTPGRKNRLT